ncbi:MAG: sigma 54-interacting transcriptional regulator [Planctomycetaceae bacterium]|nr:sigma 54-interacting transcriptional regulator [Planctomycetaceae bacterium]
MSSRPRTLGELRESGYRPVGVKQELRRNLLARLRRNEPLFPGIRGYDETVIPQVQNAILSQHDLLFLGLRGQGKTRMLRLLVELLDEAIPVVAGSEINDDPLHPLSKYARDRVRDLGDDCPVEWIGRDRRYHEKLATPDVTIADLIGEVDLVKHAEGRHLASEDVMHFGLIPRSHRGLFCMNELPDLSPKIQVGLFNVLEERDVQIRGFTIRLPVDVCMVFSANPEDYTNRGRIVTPLKDRIGSVIRTHYPLTRELGMQIVAEQSWTDRADAPAVVIPNFLKEVVEETSRLARSSPHVNQASGVSVRMSIANYENLISSAERRAVIAGEDPAVARCADLAALVSSSRGKMELTMTEEPGQEDKLVGRLIDEAVKTVFDQSANPKQFRSVVEHFEQGKGVELSDRLPAKEVLARVGEIRGFRAQVEQFAKQLEPALATGASTDGFLASVAEFILHALHCHNRLNRTAKGTSLQFGQ